VKKKSLLIIAFAWIPLFLSGCTTMDGLNQKQALSIQGCIAGGLGFGALAYWKYRNDSDRNEKIAIITAIGCMGGAIVGYKIGERTEQYADAQSTAKAEIARNEKHTAELKNINAAVKSNIAEYRKQIENLKGSTFSEQEKRDQLKEIKKHVANQKNRVEEALAEVESELALSNREYLERQSEVTIADNNLWRQKLADLEREKMILSGHATTLNAMDTSI